MTKIVTFCPKRQIFGAFDWRDPESLSIIRNGGHMLEDEKVTNQVSRRDFLKKTGYTAPVVLTLAATPAFAANGSSGAGGGGNPTDPSGGTTCRYEIVYGWRIDWRRWRLVRVPVGRRRVCS